MRKSDPAPEHLLRTDPNSPVISKKKGEEHHAEAAKVLCFSQRSRVDIKLLSGYYCARVKEPMDQCLSKFRFLTGIMWSTRLIPFVISMDDKGKVAMCAGRAHAACTDGKGHSVMF